MPEDATASGHGGVEVDATDPDVLFSVLADARRRCVLYCLHTYDTPMSLPDIADEVACWERNTDLSEVSPEVVKRIYMSLYHTHVPLLVDAGIVTYDQDSDCLTLRPAFEHVEPHLQAIDESL